MLSPSPPRVRRSDGPSGRRGRSGAASSRQGLAVEALERERQLMTQERLSWARFEGAVAEPSLADATAAPLDPYSLGAGATPPGLPHSARRTRRSLENELQAVVGGRTPPYATAALATPPLRSLGTDSDVLASLSPFDQALFALSSELDPWASRQPARLSMCDYSEFRFVAESFRRWRALAAGERARRREYSWALRSYKAAVKHHTSDLMAKGWVGWEVSAISLLEAGGRCLRHAIDRLYGVHNTGVHTHEGTAAVGEVAASAVAPALGLVPARWERKAAETDTQGAGIRTSLRTGHSILVSSCTCQ